MLLSASVKTLIADAYGAEIRNIFGGPDWIKSEHYDINATFGDSVSEKLARLSAVDRRDQIFLMLRSAMEQRFGLKIKHEQREVPVFALVVTKGGPRFRAAPPPADEAESRDYGAKITGHLWAVSREPMSYLALMLSRNPEVGRNVIDQTGLSGNYRYNFDFDPASKADPDASVFTALQEQLGLKLVPTKATIDVLVIDSIEHPSEN